MSAGSVPTSACSPGNTSGQQFHPQNQQQLQQQQKPQQQQQQQNLQQNQTQNQQQNQQHQNQQHQQQNQQNQQQQHTQQQQQQKGEINTATVCKIGQETVQEIVGRIQEIFSYMKVLAPPVGAPNQGWL